MFDKSEINVSFSVTYYINQKILTPRSSSLLIVVQLARKIFVSFRTTMFITFHNIPTLVHILRNLSGKKYENRHHTGPVIGMSSA
jgi:hypothetical protein